MIDIFLAYLSFSSLSIPSIIHARYQIPNCCTREAPDVEDLFVALVTSPRIGECHLMIWKRRSSSEL